MRELILIIAYVVCAFAPVLLIKSRRSDFSPRLFWISWLISLTGAFIGGAFGTMAMHRIGLEFGFILGIIPAMAGAWIFIGLFLSLLSIPESW